MLIRTRIHRLAFLAAVTAGVLAHPTPAAAQIDPLLFLKPSQPNVIIAVDVANRMQRAATDASGVSTYYDPWIYTASAISATQQTELGLPVGTTTYRRKYAGLTYINNPNGD